jgi:hypothetical protein
MPILTPIRIPLPKPIPIPIPSRTLAIHKLRMRDEIQTMTAMGMCGIEIEHIKEGLEIMEDCKEVIESYTELKPFRVLGFKMEFSIVATIITTGVSFFGLLFTMYFQAATTAKWER